MNQRGYTIAFVFVLLAAVAGAFFGGRFLWRQLQGGGIGADAAWKPPTSATTTARATLTPAIAPAATQAPVPGGEALAAAEATALASGRRTPTRPVIPTPAPGDIAVGTPAGLGLTATPFSAGTPFVFEGTPIGLDGTPIALGGTPLLTSTLTLTLTLTSTPDAGNWPYVLARPVRDSNGDCPGVYVLGKVTDRAGRPLPGVRLRLNDEYGNPDSKVTKGEAGVEGQYDFPVAGPPRRFYLRVVDEAGNPLSAEALIYHNSGSNPGATCHWADWQRR